MSRNKSLFYDWIIRNRRTEVNSRNVLTGTNNNNYIEENKFSVDREQSENEDIAEYFICRTTFTVQRNYNGLKKKFNIVSYH